MPEPETIIRHGLVENAAGQLKCPLCREPLTTVAMAHVTSDRGDCLVLPSQTRTYLGEALPPDPKATGIYGVTVGMTCKQAHRAQLTLVCADGYVTVKTEWEETPDARR
jgi:hypothetical protein